MSGQNASHPILEKLHFEVGFGSEEGGGVAYILGETVPGVERSYGERTER